VNENYDEGNYRSTTVALQAVNTFATVAEKFMN
jgi:hypothetical protein